MIAGRPIASFPIASLNGAVSVSSNIGNAEPGSYSITGFPAFGLRSLFANAESGAYSLSGFPAFGTKTIIANAESGAYTITGFAAFGTRALIGVASSGSYTITGFDAFGLKSFNGLADPGAYTITGFDAFALRTYIVNAEPGSYTITGFDAFGSTGDQPSTELPNEVYLKRWYVRKNGRVYVFDSSEEADAYIAADKQASAAIAKAQATSKAAKKKIRRKIYDATGIEPESVSIDYVAGIVSLYGLQFDVPNLIAQNDFETFMRVAAMAQQIEEEEIEMLLMA